jgi:iodotyrosine deiodinase
MRERATAFADELRRRRTVRDFSPDPVPREVIEQCLWAAGSAPSGANLQPWHFVVVSDPALKAGSGRRRRPRSGSSIRERAPASGWRRSPPGHRRGQAVPRAAPWLIAIFAERYGSGAGWGAGEELLRDRVGGHRHGLLIAALHHAGLATLTHTPSPMDFLNEILGRPENERPFLLLVVGYPAADARVPEIGKKPLDTIGDRHVRVT